MPERFLGWGFARMPPLLRFPWGPPLELGPSVLRWGQGTCAGWPRHVRSPPIPLPRCLQGSFLLGLPHIGPSCLPSLK
eukprot:4360446-Heterocapsa_arctica.AAC.1